MNLFNLYDKNSRNDAIIRLRGSGSAVPKKVTGKYIYAVEALNIANSIQYSNDILIIYDFGCVNDANYLTSQLLALQKNSAFTSALGYTQDLYLDYQSRVSNGNIYKKAIFELSDSITVKTETEAYYYDGSDLNVATYGVVILFTKIVPVSQSSAINGTPIATTITGDTYRAATDINNIPNRTIEYDEARNVTTTTYTASTNEYHPNFGSNLQNYINSGGNVILGNNIWQNFKIPGFQYAYSPFVYNNNYSYTDSVAIRSVNFKLTGHPILKHCSAYMNLNTQQLLNTTSDVLILPVADLISTVTVKNKEIPFIAAYKSTSGSRLVAINCYLGIKSQDTNFTKIIYNSIYWCLKKNK